MFDSFIFGYRSNNRSISCINITLVDMLILFATTPVFILECKFGEISLIKVHKFHIFALHMVNLFNELFALKFELLLIICWQILLLSNFLSSYFMFEIESSKRCYCNFFIWKLSMK